MPRSVSVLTSVVTLGFAIMLIGVFGCSRAVFQSGTAQAETSATPGGETVSYDASNVDDGIWNLLHGTDWLSANIDDRRTMASDLLLDYKEKGLIDEFSYIESIQLFTYDYPDGTSGVIPLEVFDSEKN